MPGARCRESRFRPRAFRGSGTVLAHAGGLWQDGFTCTIWARPGEGRLDTESLALTSALVVEDDAPTQQRLVRLLGELGITDVAVSGSLAQAHALLAAREFAIVLVDIGLPDGDGCELVGWLHRRDAQLPVLVISAWGHEDTVLAALRAGAIGYLLKERDDIELVYSLRSVQQGGAPIDPAIARRILAQLAQQPPVAMPQRQGVQLSQREQEVLELIARGCSNREIAGKVSLSRLTVEGYTKAIYRKLAVGSRTAAVFEAKNLGLLD